MKDIAICVIGYNRPDSIKRLLLSLESSQYKKANPTLYISIDRSDTTVVEEIARNFEWAYGEKIVIAHEENLGLRNHVLECGDLLKKHDALVVLEDDIVVSPGFYNYASACVEKYSNDKDIAGISLYAFSTNYHNFLPFIPLQSDSDVYLMQNAQSWGQVWMKQQWFEFKKWYERNNNDFNYEPHLPKSICSWSSKSWLKYHTRYCIENDKYFVYPYNSLSTCFSDAGEHSKIGSTLFQTPLFPDIKQQYNLNPTIKYDSFFECVNLVSHLSPYASSICIDFYGDKANRTKAHYWLTRNKLPYRLIKKYGLQLKPYEQNIIYQIEGNELFLYDTTVKDDSLRSNSSRRPFLYYMYNTTIDTNGYELWKHLRQIIIDRIKFNTKG